MLGKINPQDMVSDEAQYISDIFDLIDELILEQKKLKQLLSKGFMDLAQSKYILGSTQVCRYQYKKSMEASATISHRQIENEDDSEWKLIIKDVNDPSKNPLNWFGVLVPSSLRKAQTEFSDSLHIILELQKLQNNIVALEQRLKKESYIEN